MNDKEKIYIFHELNYMGGHAKITITESQIIKYMREVRQALDNRYKTRTDQELLDEFIVVNWCKEKESRRIVKQPKENNNGNPINENNRNKF